MLVQCNRVIYMQWNKLSWIAIFLFSISYSIHAQKIIKPDIQYVSIEDGFLIKEIHKLIKEEENLDTLFAKGRGYINMTFSLTQSQGPEPSNANRIDTVFSCFLGTSHMSPKMNENTLGDMYPLFYSIIDDRVICIRTNGLGAIGEYLGLSEKSKKKFDKVIEKYLEPINSESRTWINLNRETRIYYLKNVISAERSQVVVKINR